MNTTMPPTSLQKLASVLFIGALLSPTITGCSGGDTENTGTDTTPVVVIVENNETPNMSSAPVSCDEGLVCDGECTNTQTNTSHCGACDNACGAGSPCDQGSCVEQVADCRQEECKGFFYCNLGDGTCLPGCARDEQCQSNSTCDVFSHACTCGEGFHACGDLCLADTSVDSCGDRCTPCTAPENAIPECTPEGCDFSCEAGYHRCGERCLPDDSVDSCGDRCEPCETNANTASVMCIAGQCVNTCEQDALLCEGACARCPGNAASVGCDGAECVISTCSSDSLLCDGGCSTCPANSEQVTCNGGECAAATCQEGYLLCQGTCSTCPTGASQVSCEGSTCVATACESDYMMCSDGDCSACPSNAELLACTPNNQCISVPPHASVETSNGLGGIHTCAVTGMGGVKCWGANYDGQLGDGTTFNRLSPRDVAGLSGPVKAVALGSSHTCALLETGAIQCWGENEYGELGDGTTTQSSSPVNVIGLGGVAIAIGAGANHTCALLDTGKSKCWGQGDFGRKLGDNTLNNSATPVDVTDVTETATALSSGDNHNCVLTTSAKMLCWGATDSSPPGINATVIAIDAGDNHDCAVLTSGGIRCSGENDYGQLGNGMTGFSGTRIDVIGLASPVKQVSAGDEHTCALLDTGGVQCWGRNNKGQLGDGTNTDRHTPVNVTGLSSDVLVIAAGRRTTCALLTSGEVKCWGSNIYGQLGDGTETDRNTPTSIGLDLF